MIVTDRFVFLHQHKYGGSFVNRFLLESIPPARAVGYHLPRAYIPADARHLPVLGTVRNPWAYYVSWYSFQHAMASPNALFAIASEDRRHDFAGTLRNLMHLGEDPRLLDAWITRLPTQLPNRGINLSRDCVAPLRNSEAYARSEYPGAGLAAAGPAPLSSVRPTSPGGAHLTDDAPAQPHPAAAVPVQAQTVQFPVTVLGMIGE